MDSEDGEALEISLTYIHIDAPKNLFPSHTEKGLDTLAESSFDSVAWWDKFFRDRAHNTDHGLLRLGIGPLFTETPIRVSYHALEEMPGYLQDYRCR